MSNGSGHRWSKFWWQDWLADPALRMCSLEARGMWIDLLCLMHQSERSGYLQIDGKPIPHRTIALLCAVDVRLVRRTTAELIATGVASLTPDGILYSRRMVRDSEASEQGREFGKRGGNPSLRRKPDPNGGLTPGDNSGVNPDPYPDPLTGGDKLEAKKLESEAEPPVGPQPSWGPARRENGTNPRATGTNPRAAGTNPRATGDSPRQRGSNPRAKPKYRNGFLQVIENDLAAERELSEAQQRDLDEWTQWQQRNRLGRKGGTQCLRINAPFVAG
jgi:hypothetical protein